MMNQLKSTMNDQISSCAVMTIWKRNNIDFIKDSNVDCNNVDYSVDWPPGGWQLIHQKMFESRLF